jgi:beta-glucanase (GH16 family)
VPRARLVIGVLAALNLVLSGAAGPGSGERAIPVLEDDFDAPVLNTTLWNTCYWWGNGDCTIMSNSELQWYLPSQVRLSDGTLKLTADAVTVHTPEGDFPYASGMINTGPETPDRAAKFAFTYGTVEARFRVPAGQGLWAAVWMLPASQESRPEIDILEVLGSDTREAHFNLHLPSREEESRTQSRRGKDLAEGWHLIRLEWTPSALRWFVDDALAFTVEGEQVPDEPMYLIVNLAVGGNWPGSPGPETRFPASLMLDYLRVWKNSSTRIGAPATP